MSSCRNQTKQHNLKLQTRKMLQGYNPNPITIVPNPLPTYMDNPYRPDLTSPLRMSDTTNGIIGTGTWTLWGTLCTPEDRIITPDVVMADADITSQNLVYVCLASTPQDKAYCIGRIARHPCSASVYGAPFVPNVWP